MTTIAQGEATLADPDLFTRDPSQFERTMKALEAVRAE